MSLRSKIRNWLIGRALDKCADPFEEGRIIVMLNFSVFMFFSNIPYTIISYGAFPGHFISSLVQDFAMIAVILLLNRGYKLNLARDVFFANFMLQNVYHFFINNGAKSVMEQGILFFLMICVFAFLLYGKVFGWIVTAIMTFQLWIGIYNAQTGYSVFRFPDEWGDPMMKEDMAYLIVLPILMNVYLVSQFVRAQLKAKDRIYVQNNLLSEKNREITDSINYAKRIQDAILPTQAQITAALSDSFVLYIPKDIVAGDFYYLEKTPSTTYLAVADCTGHGVPGAMLSVLCANSITRSLKEFNLKDSGQILDKTRELVVANLSARENELNDGMDISFLALSNDRGSALWSGANNPLWIVRNNNLIEYKGDKQPVGVHHRENNFTSHSISPRKGDMLYMLTDGFKDQFGGPKEKKFTVQRLKNLLLRIHKMESGKQKNELRMEFEKWRGNLEQIDDVCIVGVRINE